MQQNAPSARISWRSPAAAILFRGPGAALIESKFSLAEKDFPAPVFSQVDSPAPAIASMTAEALSPRNERRGEIPARCKEGMC
jgi:hypothetical protein